MPREQKFEIIAANNSEICRKIQSMRRYKGIVSISTPSGEVMVRGYHNTLSGSYRTKRFIGTSLRSSEPGLADVEDYVKKVLSSCNYGWLRDNNSGKMIQILGDEERGLTLKCIS